MIDIEEIKRKLEDIYYSFLNNDLIKKMKDIPMHRGSNCYIHSFLVAKLAIKRALRHNKELNLEAILVSSILHDYYLYNWRENKELLNKHGSKHPKVANENAKRDFDIIKLESDIILSHMWPINFKDFPKTTEARIVALADKNVATIEAFTSKKYKMKRINKTMKRIASLF
ncbi:MAG: HD domain-containing protein [Bacilli bacterium]|jgi:uncharacterized protein|nr:HD domain-containing protein [Bacilli bacterium]